MTKSRKPSYPVYYSKSEDLILVVLQKFVLKNENFVLVFAGSEVATWLLESDLNKFDLEKIGEL